MHDVKIRFTTNLRSERYDTDVEVILYRVVCELVNNSLKHSGCTEINLSLSKSGDTLALDYTDNGRGFNPRRRDRLRHGVVEHRFAYQLPERAVRHHECQRRRYAGENPGQHPG